ncbi:MAG: hypothetical protein HFG83_08060 [Dorea sp.]|nr:hypothetical protein [Dorea sp.]
MKRICIYLTYDKQKIADKYIGFMLKELRTCVEFLVVVCNTPFIAEGRENLEAYADAVFYRENTGFDAGGYKDALCHLIGWDKVLAFDELVLVNDSMFGPFRPMKSIFEEMDENPVDFWGLSKHAEFRKAGFDYFPEHIQSFFFVLRSRMLHSVHFRKYWEDMPYYASYNETVRKYEMQFTSWFSGLGYTYDVLADTQINDSENLEINYAQFRRIPYELIKKRNFPFLKKQQIADESLDKQTQENLRQAIDYIDKETNYNTDFIWENIIRTLNMADLQRSLHLQYIISPAEKKQRMDTLILAVVSYESAVEYVVEYLQELEKSYDIKLISNNCELAEYYQKQGFACRTKFDSISRYEYICIIHDTDMSSTVRESCTNKSYFYNIWENLAKNNRHISGILERFRQEPRLGALMPPTPNFAEYFGELGTGWMGKFEAIRCIAEKLGIHCQLAEELPPFGVSGSLWIRGKILERVKEMEESDFTYLPYLWSFIAQDAGYYSGIVQSADYAAMNEVNLQYYLNGLAEQIRNQYGAFSDFVEMKKKISQGALREFCRKYSRIFIYGTGVLARRYGELIPNTEAHIISDGEEKPEEWNGVQVKYLSEVSQEIAARDECGIILCLNKKNQTQVKKLLCERGIKKYLCI